MPMEDKQSQNHIQLSENWEINEPTVNEKLPSSLRQVIQSVPFIYEDTQRLTVGALNANGRVSITSALNQLLVHFGFDLFSKLSFELKSPKAQEVKEEKEE